MEQEKRRIWFPYLSVDYKAAEARLNELGAQGWRLTDFGSNLLTQRFPTLVRGSRPVRYCVVLAKSYPHREPYLELCAEAGWQFICCTDGLDYFVSAPGERPVPVETDPVLERRKALRHFLFNTCLCGGMALLLTAALASLFLGRDRYRYADLLYYLQENYQLAGIVPLLLSTLLMFWRAGVNLRYLLRCRRMDRPPAATQRQARRRGTLSAVLGVLYFCVIFLQIPAIMSVGRYADEPSDLRASPVVMGEDLGMGSPRRDSGYLREKRSVLLHGVEYTEYPRTEEGERIGFDIYSQRYEARWSWMARLAERLLLWQEGTGRTGHQQAREYHGPLDFAPAELGFDAAWIAHGEGYDTLILRQGDITACIEAPADLTDPALLARVAGRLELEGSAYG